MSAKKTGKILSRSISIDNPNKIKIACVISEWHNEITESFYSGALNKFSQYGILENNIDKVYVPGSFELIFATKNPFEIFSLLMFQIFLKRNNF